MTLALRISKKAKKIEEKKPDDWEDIAPPGARHVKSSESGVPTTDLEVTDQDGNMEKFKLSISSTYIREGDWVTIIGNEKSSEEKHREKSESGE